jgi:hypothetical protein
MTESLAPRPIAVTLAILVALVSGARDAQASSAELSIEVDGAQNVTVVGSGPSLRDTIVEICERANVKLLAYEAADRSFSASYRDIPLSEALARLLRSEAYLAGVQSGSGTPPSTQVNWLRVTGSAGGVGGVARPVSAAAAQRMENAESAFSRIDLGVPPKVLETALASGDAGARNSARRAVILALREDPAPLERSLARDTSEFVKKLAVFPHAVELVQSLESVAGDANERTLLRGLTHDLRVRQEAGRREAERRIQTPE